MAKKNKYEIELEKKHGKTGRRRKVSYEKEVKPFLEDIKKLIVDGYNNKEIAKIIGCNEATIYNWRKIHKEFNEIFECEELKNKMKDELMLSLFERAKGFKVEELTTMMVKGKEQKMYNERYIYSDKAADIVLRNVLGGASSHNEINITLKDGDKTLNLKVGTVDDEGDFEEARK